MASEGRSRRVNGFSDYAKQRMVLLHNGLRRDIVFGLLSLLWRRWLSIWMLHSSENTTSAKLQPTLARVRLLHLAHFANDLAVGTAAVGWCEDYGFLVVQEHHALLRVLAEYRSRLVPAVNIIACSARRINLRIVLTCSSVF